MASITERKNKDGTVSYLIRVSHKYAADGKQRRYSMTWTPPNPKLSQKTIKKQLDKVAHDYEEMILSGIYLDGKIKFQAYSEQWFEDYAKRKLKSKTWSGYARLLPRVNEAIGHLRLEDIHTGHLEQFYRNLEENGMRRDTKTAAKVDFKSLMKKKGLTQATLAAAADVSIRTVQSAYRGQNINLKSAEKIAKALEMPKSELFMDIDIDATLSPETIRSYHLLISSIFARAVKEKRIKYNPAAGAELPTKTKKEAAHLDEADVRRILELLQDEPIQYRTPIIFDILSGLRRGELLGLPRNAIDFENETIRIHQTLNYTPEKGVFLDTPKNATSSRPLKLSRTAFLLLIEYLKWQDHQRELCGDYWKNKDGLLFTQADGSRIHPDTLTKWFRKFADKHGYPQIHIHSLRHTYASLMIAEGTPLVVVSKRLGHAQVSTTANIYSHVIQSADEAAAQITERFTDAIMIQKDVSETA